MSETLRIHLVVENILENLQFPDLINCRMVNSLWNHFSSSIILKRDSCEVKFVYDYTEEGSYRHYRQLNRKWRNSPSGPIPLNQQLTTLNTLLKNSNNNNNNIFPSSSFSFKWGTLEDDVVQNFFDTFGNNIKSLELIHISDTHSPTSKKTLQDILLIKVPHLENLTVDDFDYDPNTFEPPLAPLTCLKTLSWDHSSSNIALEIMRGAKNLQELNNSNYDDKIINMFHLPIVNQAGTIAAAAVKKFVCDVWTDIDLDTLTFFLAIGGGATLEELTFHSSFPFLCQPDRHQQVMGQFLDACKNSLRVLILSKSFCKLDHIIPRLSRLKILKLESGHGARRVPHVSSFSEIYFPVHIDLLHQTFPNIHTLDVSAVHWSRDLTWSPPYGVLASVTRLEISDKTSRSIWLDGLQGLCPNFTELIIHIQPLLPCMMDDESVQPKILPIIFSSWKHLQALELQVKVQPYQSFCLDSAFTGMSTTDCERLKDNLNSEREEGYHQLKKRAAIHDLTELKSLKILLECSSYYVLDKVSRKEIPLTHVSCLYAFQLLPQLKVTLVYDQSCQEAEGLQAQFDSIAPFVALTHKQFYKGAS